MNASAGLSIHQQLIALLNRSHARYRVVEHEAVGRGAGRAVLQPSLG